MYKVEDYFVCSWNNLRSLIGCPTIVYGGFDCSYNQLESLEGCPKYVGGDFWCHDNNVKFTEEYVRSLCNVQGKVII